MLQENLSSNEPKAAPAKNVDPDIVLYRESLVKLGMPKEVVAEIDNPNVLIKLGIFLAPKEHPETKFQSAQELRDSLGTSDGPGIQICMLATIADKTQNHFTRYAAAYVLQGAKFEYAGEHLLSWVMGQHPANSPVGELKATLIQGKLEPALDHTTRELAAIALRSQEHPDIIKQVCELLHPEGVIGTEGLKESEKRRQLAALIVPYLQDEKALDAICKTLDSSKGGLELHSTAQIVNSLILPYAVTKTIPEYPDLQKVLQELKLVMLPDQTHKLIKDVQSAQKFPWNDVTSFSKMRNAITLGELSALGKEALEQRQRSKIIL